MTNITVNGYTLDEEQTKPIVDNPKYSIIIAGAGSGKSLTLVGKIKYLLANNIYQKEEILCISFTNEATNNLQKNILKNTGMVIATKTFHRLALDILKLSKTPYSILESDYLTYIVDEIINSNLLNNSLLTKAFLRYYHIHFFKEKKLNKILHSKEINSLKKTIITFISLFASNNYQKKDFYLFLKKTKNKDLLIIIYIIYNIYENEKRSANLIDFDDMILLATKLLDNESITLPYKMIIIDEFQDTSLNRFNLIKKIIKKNDAFLCVVGDDYQSIYHFSGCDLNLFLNFKDYFPNTKQYFLNNTYRNSQELITTMGNFIMKNTSQIKKSLKSAKRINKPIKIIYYQNEKTILKKIIKSIPEQKEIFILGRNNMDIKSYLKNNEYKLENSYLYIKNDHHKIRFLTIHSSKGLESEIVILLNVNNGVYGLPSRLKDEEILSLVKERQNYPFEEERRLFYVALTRTKSIIYLLVDINNPSRFIKEIKYNKNVEKKFM